MKIILSDTCKHKIIEWDVSSQDQMTEIGEILFVNCLWGQRDKAEAIATYIKSLGYVRKETG